MTTVISGDPGALGGLAALRPTANETDPEWLLRIRRDAAAWFHDHGLPTRKDEDWRYTRLEPITTVPFRPAVPGNWPVSDVAATDLGGPRLVFVNGHFRADRSRLAGVPSGARVTNLATAIAEDGDRVRSAFTGAARPEAQAFEELNTVLAEDGAYIHLAPGTVVDQPIELVFLSDVQGEAMVASPRSILLAEPNSKVTVVETHCASGGGAQGSTLSNAVTQVVLGDEADVALYRVQDEPETAFHIALLDVRQCPRSRFAAHSFAIGAAMGRHEVRVRLEGAGAEVHLHGLSMSRGDQQHDNPILVEHIAPHCTSRQLYKGIADGGSHSVFNGHIVVRPGA
jgi:Fe-S cluster assembly protein SufD